MGEIYRELPPEFEAILEGRKLRYSTMPYDEYLRTERWTKKAKRCKGGAGWKCQICNNSPPLHVHHRTYKNRGNEHWSDLIAVCIECHKMIHENVEIDGVIRNSF